MNCSATKGKSEYGVRYWPSVGIGEFSQIPCPHGLGFAIRKCLNNGLFETHPNWTQCYYWMNEIQHNVINNVSDILTKAQIIFNNTIKNNSIINDDKLTDILDSIEEKNYSKRNWCKNNESVSRTKNK